MRFSRIALECHETADGFWGSGEPITITLADRRASRPAGAVSGIVFEDISGSAEGALNIVSVGAAAISNVTLARIHIDQRPGPFGNGRCYDLRPTSADLAPPTGMAGRANAWVRDVDGSIVGLVPYPGGLPGLFAPSVEGLAVTDVTFSRPSPLPVGWNPASIVTTA